MFNLQTGSTFIAIGNLSSVGERRLMDDRFDVEHAVFQALVPPGFRQCGQDVSFSDRRRALPCEIRSLVTDIDRVAERSGTINVLPDFSPHRAGVSPKPARSTDTRRHRPLRK